PGTLAAVTGPLAAGGRTSGLLGGNGFALGGGRTAQLDRLVAALLSEFASHVLHVLPRPFRVEPECPKPIRQRFRHVPKLQRADCAVAPEAKGSRHALGDELVPQLELVGCELTPVDPVGKGRVPKVSLHFGESLRAQRRP